MENVQIVISQNGVTVYTLYTDSSGDASTLLNAGIYTCTFTYPNRLPVTTDITINYDNTMLIFAFPYTQLGGGASISTTPFLSQAIAFYHNGTATLISPVTVDITTTPTVTNSA